ncbi:MAG TPA: amidohydrolase family protein [Armatimonadota bacterium]|nr:amidohydrolase family protein [Armatimonadota bacterium]HOS42974.1 amidohydrolase family protein [Armatimonadota bacterium]
MMPIIDLHQHAPTPDGLDARVQACRDAGIVTAVILGQPESRVPGDNALTLAAARAYPTLFRAWYGVDMDADGPDAITRARDVGFTGVKCIGPKRAYNDPGYFPLYERAADLQLPVLFHLGIVANTPGYQDCDSNLMRAIHLDHLARCLPELTLIGAHFGNPWPEEAAMACRWNPNLYFDLSGSLLKYRRPAFLGELLWWKADGPYAAPDRSDAWAKIVFGSDVASPAIADVVNDYAIVMDTLKLDDGLCCRIWHDTAARIVGPPA